MNDHANKGRNTPLAVFLALAMPGLGQVYTGELIKGISYFLIILAMSIVGVQGTVLLPDRMMIFGAMATILACGALYIATVAEAIRKASRSDGSFQLKPYNRWYFYLAMWLLGGIAWGAVRNYSTENYVEAYKIPTASMEPAVRQGDCVLADKTAYRRMPPKKGDIVIFVSPDDRSKKFIKRIEALPGETVVSADGTAKEVPHGSVYVLGDNRDKSYDSRKFGFIPLRDVIGKVRQVYFSSGMNGILWDRIGAVVGSRR
ncbi:MAG TPA: signal peptidase I [Acidobacteriota bacterium]|nr:signal peptidase I [Acidobacteriota bacterium]